MCLLFHQQSSIIVITLNIFGTGTLSSILVELHKMIGMLHAPDSYFLPNMPCCFRQSWGDVAANESMDQI